MRALVILVLVFICGCQEIDSNGVSNGELKQPWVVENAKGQTTVTVEYVALKSWLEGNRDARIWSICPVSRVNNGSTSFFVITYEKMCEHNHACPVCGQQLPAEKASP